MNRYAHHIGKVFNSLTCEAHAELDKAQPNRSKYVFRCLCGSTRIVMMFNVSNNSIKACKKCATLSKSLAAAKNRNATKHELTATPIWLSWLMMKQRCDNPNNADYKYYGGRGISYDPKWKEFEVFYKDMKEGHFKGATLDKINNDKNYCKANCQWLTRQQNSSKGNSYDSPV